MKRALFKRMFLCLATLAMASLPGCYSNDQSEIVRVGGDAFEEPDGDSYSLDIIVLSEWAGRFLTQTVQRQVYFCYDSKDSKWGIFGNWENTYQCNFIFDLSGSEESEAPCSISGSEASVSIECNLYPELLGVSKEPEYLGILAKDIKLSEVEDLTSYCLNESDKNRESCKEALQKFTYQLFVGNAEFNLGGALALQEIWKTWRTQSSDENVPVLQVSAGDNFGASQKESSNFGDAPVPLLLNQLGQTVDAFGNHSFDQNLDYLQKIVEYSEYPFVASNLKNLSQNINDVAQFALAKIHADGDVDGKEHSPLYVGIVGAIDPEASKSVYPGRFGSLGITEYCNVIQSMELAYNAGARAFLIAAHVYMDFNYPKNFFDAIHGLVEAYDENECYSKLIIDDALRAKYGDTKGQNKKAVTAIRRDIFDGLIGVIGEAGNSLNMISTPMSKKDSQNDTVSENISKFEACVDSYIEDLNLNDEAELKEKLYSNNRISLECKKDHMCGCDNKMWNDEGDPERITQIYYKSGCVPCGGNGISDYITGVSDEYFDKKTNDTHNRMNQVVSLLGTNDASIYKYERVVTDKEEAYSPYMFLQIPPKGEVTARVRAKIHKIGNADHYSADVVSVETLPVLSKAPVLATLELNGSVCEDQISSMGTKNGCFQYYKRYTELQSDQKIEESEKKQLVDACLDVMSKQYKDRNNPSETSWNARILNEDVSEQVKTWACLYNAAERFLCAENGAFIDIPIYKLGGEANAELKYDLRYGTSFIGNVVVDQIMDSLNTAGKSETESQKYDIAYVNAGALRGIDSAYRSFTKVMFSNLLPYGNAMTVAEMNVDEFVKIIEYGLEGSGNGQFSMVSGALVSFIRDDNNKVTVCDIWQTKWKSNEYQLVKPFYYREDAVCNNAHAIAALVKNPEQCKDVKDEDCMMFNASEMDKSVQSNPKDTKVRFRFYTENGSSDDSYSKDSAASYSHEFSRNDFSIQSDHDGNIYMYPQKLKVLTPDFVSQGGDGYSNVFKTSAKSVPNSVMDVMVIDSVSALSQDAIGSENMCGEEESENSTVENREMIKKWCVNRLFASTTKPLHGPSDKVGDIQSMYLNNGICETIDGTAGK